jgi:hypothetical protein
MESTEAAVAAARVVLVRAHSSRMTWDLRGCGVDSRSVGDRASSGKNRPVKNWRLAAAGCDLRVQNSYF